jgi:hypothetical protein
MKKMPKINELRKQETDADGYPTSTETELFSMPSDK